MIENEDLGLKIAETTDESFWTNTKEQCQKAIETEQRNIKINERLIILCDEELQKI
jgi:hypothetical protein